MGVHGVAMLIRDNLKPILEPMSPAGVKMIQDAIDEPAITAAKNQMKEASCKECLVSIVDVLTKFGTADNDGLSKCNADHATTCDEPQKEKVKQMAGLIAGKETDLCQAAVKAQANSGATGSGGNGSGGSKKGDGTGEDTDAAHSLRVIVTAAVSLALVA